MPQGSFLVLSLGPASIHLLLAPRSLAPMGTLSMLQDLRLQYPLARRDESVVDDYHGVPVSDPYRWQVFEFLGEVIAPRTASIFSPFLQKRIAKAVALKLEDPDTDEVKDFVEKQANLTDALLQSCDTREKLKHHILKLYDHPRFDTPFKRGKKYFYSHNTGLQAQSVLYLLDDLEGEPEVLLDPNTLSDDGTVALSVTSVSEDAKFLAYGVSASGSDWITIKVMRIDDKHTEPDSLSWVKFSSISWTHDNKGFFYTRYPAPREGEQLDAGTGSNINSKLYYHFLGTDQSQDILCWRDPDHPKWLCFAQVTEDGKYLLLNVHEGCDPVNKLYYCDLSTLPGGLEGLRGKNDMLPVVKLIDSFEALYEVVANDGSVCTFRTNRDAPRYKLVCVDLKDPRLWTDVIQEAEKDVLKSAIAVNGDQLLVSYLSNCKYVLQVRDLKSGQLLHNIPLEIGTVCGISGKRKNPEVFISFTSFLAPGIIYRCNLASGVPEMKIFHEILVSGFDRTEFEVNQVFVPSKDETMIPLFLVSKKNIVLDNSHPSLLYGYGGFSISITPSFSASRIVLMRHLGVVFAIANIRGGGEYGEEWHKAGSLSKKQNCFDDFISAAEYLVSAGYTHPQKLCVEGESNGGLLIAACVNRRPDLFGCALAHVGVMDMLRFHKFTIGHAWTSEYGCSDNEEEFHWLIKYSPLHNVKRPWEELGSLACQYPAIMLLTADHDDRVVPSHSLKLLATLQYVLCTGLENSKQTNPVIARIDRKAGHGAGRPTQKVIDEAADSYSFMAKMLGISWQE